MNVFEPANTAGACDSPSLIRGTVRHQIGNLQSNIFMVTNPATAPLRYVPLGVRPSSFSCRRSEVPLYRSRVVAQRRLEELTR